MEMRLLGRTGMSVSALGFGASEIGHNRVPLKTAAEILGSALDAGLNLSDTAACYGDGEELIGRTAASTFISPSGLPSAEYDSIREMARNCNVRLDRIGIGPR